MGRNLSQTTPAITPVKLPKDLSATSLSKHIADLASKIKIAITRNNSTHKQDKDEIKILSDAIVAASKKISETMAPTTVINDISSTDLLSSIRGIVQDEIKQSAPQISYANVVNQPSQQKSKPPTVSRPAIIIASKDKTQKSSDVLGAWRQNISFRSAAFNPARVQPVSNNKIRVEFDNEKQRDDILKRTMEVDGLEVEVGKRRRPLMIIKGINKMTIKEDAIQLITESNPTVKEAAEPEAGPSSAPSPDAPIRMCFARKNWNERLYNLVIEVSPKVRHALLNLGRVNIDHQRVHVADFSHFVQCYHCLQFGHTRSKCPDADTEDFHRCSHCASTEHDYQHCPVYKDKKKMRCYNCHQHNVRTQDSVNDAHSATSSKHCPRVKAVLTRINERVQYD